MTKTTPARKTFRPSSASASKKAAPVKPVAAIQRAAKPAVPAVGVAKAAPKMTRVSLALELIKAGRSNAEVQAALVEKFALPESHDYYARWYRAHAVQKGIITKEFAKAHSRGPEVPASVEKMPAAEPTKKAASKAKRSAKK